MEIEQVVIRECIHKTSARIDTMELEFREIARIPIDRKKFSGSVSFSTYLRNIARVEGIYLSEIDKTLYIELPKESNVAIGFWEWDTAYFKPVSTIESIHKLEEENAKELTTK